MKFETSVFINNYDNFLDILLGLTEPPEELKELFDNYSKLPRPERTKVECEVLETYLKFITNQ